MILNTEKFGFESDDLAAVTAAISRALEVPARPRFYEGFGGDFSSFGKYKEAGGVLSLYRNHFHDGEDRVVQEESFPELGLILLVEQRGEYKNYEPILAKMDTFKPILLLRRRYDDETREKEILFDLASGQAQSES